MSPRLSICVAALGATLLIACEPPAMVGYRRSLAGVPHAPPARLDEDPFPGAAVLERRALIEAVLARNPDVDAARAAWRRALARVPQEGALDDPRVSYAFAPLAIAGDAPFGQRVEIEQRLPLDGRRERAAEVALAEADAAREDAAAVRLRLAGLASAMFDDYYVAERALDVDARDRALLEQVRASATAQYTAGRGAPQDALQADVELALVERDRLAHETARTIAVAQLNGLLHREPGAHLPSPPAQLPAPAAAPRDEHALIDDALAARPELRGQDARVRRGDAARALADRSGWPAVGVMGAYDSMWAMPEHRWMLGVSVEVPLARGKREAMRDEARAGADEARFTRARMADDIRVEVRTAIARAGEADAALALYDQRLLPSLRAQAEAVRAGYVTGAADLRALLAAERALRQAELERARADADVHRRLAALDLAAGRLPGGAR